MLVDNWSSGQNGHHIGVEISQPLEKEECPITCCLISESNHIFDTHLVFFLDEPLLTKGTLPCKHSFAIVHLAYHFMSNNMRCPICRSGYDTKLEPQCLPKHVSRLFQARMALAIVREDQDEENQMSESIINITSMQRLLNVNIFRYILPFSGGTNRINVTVKLRVSISRMDASNEFTNFIMLPMRRAARLQNSQNIYFVVESSMLNLRQFLLRHRAVEMRFTVMIGCPANASDSRADFVPMARTPSLQLPFLEGQNNEWFQSNNEYNYVQTIDPYTNRTQLGCISFFPDDNSYNILRGNMDFPFKRIQWEPNDQEADETFNNIFAIQGVVSMVM